jgi:DNA polymerase III subunit beta
MTTLTIGDPALFRAAVTWGASVISGKPANLWYTALRVGWAGAGALEVAGFDGDVATESVIPVSGEGDPGTFYVPGVMLAAIAGALGKGPVTLETDGEGLLHIRSGAARWRIRTVPWDDNIPALPAPPKVTGTVAAGDLRYALNAVMPALGTDEALPQLMSVQVTVKDGALSLVATDRYRLAYADAPWEHADTAEPAVILVPGRIAAMAAKHADGPVEVCISETAGQVSFAFGGYRITGRLGAGQYPDAATYRAKAAVPVMTVDVLAEDLGDALARVALVLTKSEPVTLDVSTGQVALAAGTNADTAAEVIGATVESTVGDADPHMVVTVNPVYLAQMVRAAQHGQVSIALASPTHPLVITGGDAAGTYCCLLMPLRTDQARAAAA